MYSGTYIPRYTTKWYFLEDPNAKVFGWKTNVLFLHSPHKYLLRAYNAGPLFFCGPDGKIINQTKSLREILVNNS